MTDEQKQQTKVELKALLEELTASDASGAAIGTELDELENGAGKLESDIAAAEPDIDAIVEESGKEMDALVAEEQADEI